MALNNMQERLERTVFEAIRSVVVTEGYFPDEAALVGQPSGEATLVAAITTIVGIKGFAVEVFGCGSAQSKYEKKVPRIVLISRRSIMGDLGGFDVPIVYNDPQQPHLYLAGTGSNRSSHIQIDVNIVSNTAQQDRVLGAIVLKALGQLKHIQIYDDPNSYVLIQQFNYYDVPDVTEGIIEKTFCYQLPDVFLEDIPQTTPPALITDIHTTLTIQKPGTNVTPAGNNSSEIASDIHLQS